MKYDVTIYVVARVKFAHIEAESQTDAIDRAEEKVNFEQVIDRHFDLPSGHAGVEYVTYADEVENYLVDEVGDEQYEKTAIYDSERRIVVEDVCLKCGRPWPAPDAK